ncbi:hypothetical protein CPB83DRAFT_844159 [Crepidotus variabilis]|uniref:PX-domain-containing protein n=1 Tax=Crepidotus variabilis TaxID=179855 RepID=A0A9P6ETJ0_9AGAR|nr:hypothetical protein CPB83DRAFT_844159 [Crepidotus variabilis]
MATLPRPSRLIVPLSAGGQRPVSDFDAGINTSNAWTVHLESGETPAATISKSNSRKWLSESNSKGSISDEELDEPEELTRPARALYAFEGKAEFRELTVEAGDELEMVKEDVGEGWSLVKDTTGEVGLLPKTYYTLTTELTPSRELQLDFSNKREVSDASLTPRGSPRSPYTGLPSILPQNTGEWLPLFPSFRQSLLGGKTLNRFSTFVTSGAEAFLLNGSPAFDPPMEVKASTSTAHMKEDTTASQFEASQEERSKTSLLGMGEADLHRIDTGSAGPVWRPKTPAFTVLVHSPMKRTSALSGAYTMYSVTSVFPSQDASTPTDWVDIPDPDDVHPPSPTSTTGPNGETVARITVQRRFSHFVMLHTVLSRRLPGIALPPLPEKQYAGRFSHDFVEARRGDLERYLNKIVRHPIIRYAEILTIFLSAEDENEWTRIVPQHISAPSSGPAFYSRIYHPAFNVDGEDAEDAVYSFQTHTRAVGKGVQGLRSVFGRVREARIEMSKAERLLSYSLLSLITSKPLASALAIGATAEEESGGSPTLEKPHDKKRGLTNKDNAWCWREGCSDCLSLSKAVQKTSETLQTVANLYDGHARSTQLSTHESLKLMAHPSSLYEGTISTHKATLARYREATGSSSEEDIAARCETVLNTTMAEMDTYHAQKVQDLRSIAVDHLDGEIAFYEQILTRLKTSRAAYDGLQYAELATSPRQPSIYEKDLGSDPSNNPNLYPQPLPQPCPHVYDSAPMRPVSVAIQEGVGMFLGDGSGKSRVFSKFW